MLIKNMTLILLSLLSGLSATADNRCLDIQNNKLCFNNNSTEIRKEHPQFLDKKKYREQMLLESKEAISRSKIAVYKLGRFKKASEEVTKKWNNIVNTTIQKDIYTPPLLTYLTNKTPDDKLLIPALTVNKIIEYIQPNTFKVNMTKDKNEIVFDISIDKKYIKDIWRYLKPTKKCKAIIKENNTNFNQLGSSQTSGGLQVFELGDTNNECFTPFANEKEFSSYLNTTIENEINSNISTDTTSYEQAKMILNYGEHHLLKKIKKINNYASWKKETMIKIQKDYQRSVFIVDSFPRNIKAPKIDNGIGNLYILSTHYYQLMEQNLLSYLMLHESAHIQRGMENITERIDFIFDGEFSKIVNIMCENRLITDDLDDHICSKNARSIELKKQYDTLAKRILEHKKLDEELLIDLTILSNLPKKRREKYINMLKLIFPNYRRQRIIILREYLDILNHIESINISKHDLSASFKLLQIQNENSINENNLIIFIQSLLKFNRGWGDPKSRESKTISGVLERTFKMNQLHDVYKAYKKLYKLKSLSTLKTKIGHYLEQN